MEYRQNGRLVGYDIDFGNELAKHLNVKAEWVEYDDLKDLVERIEQGGDDKGYTVAISATTDSVLTNICSRHFVVTTLPVVPKCGSFRN